MNGLESYECREQFYNCNNGMCYQVLNEIVHLHFFDQIYAVYEECGLLEGKGTAF